MRSMQEPDEPTEQEVQDMEDLNEYDTSNPPPNWVCDGCDVEYYHRPTTCGYCGGHVFSPIHYVD